MWLSIGGFACGFLAGAAARYGRLCTMSAIEDAALGRDWRAAKAWALALAIAMVLTVWIGREYGIEFSGSVYTTRAFDLGEAALGGLLFGLGMALAGTCSFGLLVRAGAGDLRAGISALVVGIAAFAFTAGLLSPLREVLTGHAPVDLAGRGGPLVGGLVEHALQLDPGYAGMAIPLGLAVLLALPALTDRRLSRRPRLVGSALLLGVAVAVGWAVTALGVDRLETTRLESLSFVAPVGRLLLVVMGAPFHDQAFGVASVAGVLAGSFAGAMIRADARVEAFDDAREMRRHLLGALLMGIGGVLARGCTIGQGMSAASALAASAPVVVLAMIAGARLGLFILLEGHALWRRSGRA